MKSLPFLLVLLISSSAIAALQCPQPSELKAEMMSFRRYPIASDDSSPSKEPPYRFMGQTFFEAQDAVWHLTLGLVSEERPRLQAKQLLTKAQLPQVATDKDSGERYCVYLKNHLDNPLRMQFIIARPAPELKPCPSLTKMKQTPFTHLQEICGQGKTGCGDYATLAEDDDRGTHWIFLSFNYRDPATALTETEQLKKKAFGPIISDGIASCIYFRGLTRQGPRAIIALTQPESKSLPLTKLRAQAMKVLAIQQ